MASAGRDLDSDGSLDDHSAKQARRSVACKRCHALKVKCVPHNHNNPAGPCVRCVARNHDCILDLNHVRKRRKKIDILNERLSQQAARRPLAPSSPSSAQAKPFPPPSSTGISVSRFSAVPSQGVHSHSLLYDHDGALALSFDRPFPLALRLSAAHPAAMFPNLDPSININHTTVAMPLAISLAISLAIPLAISLTIPLGHTPLPPMSPYLRHDNAHALAPMPSLPSQLSYMPLAPFPPVPAAPDQPGPQSLQRPADQPLYAERSASATASSVPTHNSQSRLQTPTASAPGPLARADPPVSVKALASPPSTTEVERLKHRVMTLESLLEKASSPASSILSHNGSPPADLPGFVCKADLEKEVAAFANLTTSITSSSDDLLAIAGRRCSLFRAERPRDVVSAGIMSLKDARLRLDLYRSRLYPAFPAVKVDPATLVPDMQLQCPLLLNAVVSVTNSLVVAKSDYDTALRIDNFAVEAVTNEIMVMGTKSEELLRTLTLLCAWYNSPERFRNRRYHLLNKLCVTLVHDLGLLLRPDPARPHDFPRTVNNLLVDTRIIVLAIYATTVNICIIVRRQVFVRWLAFAEECCASLERSHNPECRQIALGARICNVLDKIHHVLHNPDRADPYTLDYFVRNLTSQLEALRLKVDPHDHATLSYMYTVQAYLHEPCLDSYLAAQDLNSPAVFDDATVRAITNCTRACVSCLGHFRKVPAEQVSTMPFYHVARIMYTGGILLRLRYFILSLPSQVEKGLVPLNAIDDFKGACSLISSAIDLHPFNHSLVKCQVVLRLFVHTYSTQVRELLASTENSPSVAKMSRVHEEMANAARKFDTDPLLPPDASLPSQLSLLILSHAADYRRTHSVGNSRDQNGAGAGATATATATAGPSANNHNESFANPLAQPANMPGTAPPSVSGPLSESTNGQRPAHPYRQPSLSLMSQLGDTLDSPRLDGAFWQLNDEFWSDLLHTSSDRVNFSNTTKPQTNFLQTDDLFYLHNMGESRRGYGA